MPRIYTWYVEPLDARTNEVIAKGLSQDTDESPKTHARLEDGRYHDLWKLPFSVVAFLSRSKGSLGLSFNVCNRAGQGKIRKVPLIIPFRRKKPAPATKPLEKSGE